MHLSVRAIYIYRIQNISINDNHNSVSISSTYHNITKSYIVVKVNKKILAFIISFKTKIYSLIWFNNVYNNYSTRSFVFSNSYMTSTMSSNIKPNINLFPEKPLFIQTIFYNPRFLFPEFIHLLFGKDNPRRITTPSLINISTASNF